MKLRTGAHIAFAIAIVPMALVGYFVHRDLIATNREGTPAGHSFGGATVGDDHLRVLTKLTRSYVASKAADVTPGMRKGTELAPRAYLNDALEQQGLKWRVREVHGLVAVTYDVA